MKVVLNFEFAMSKVAACKFLVKQIANYFEVHAY